MVSWMSRLSLHPRIICIATAVYEAISHRMWYVSALYEVSSWWWCVISTQKPQAQGRRQTCDTTKPRKAESPELTARSAVAGAAAWWC